VKNIQRSFLRIPPTFFRFYSKAFRNVSRLAIRKAIFQKNYSKKVHKRSLDKEFRTTITQNFITISEVADLYKTEEYADDIENNYALVAEEHYYSVNFDGITFKRIVKMMQLELKNSRIN
jgi:hypothetical protein